MGDTATNKISISDIQTGSKPGAVLGKAEQNYDIMRTKDGVIRLFSKKGEILNQEIYEQVLKGESIEVEQEEGFSENEEETDDTLDV